MTARIERIRSLTELVEDARADPDEGVGTGEDGEFGTEAPFFRDVIPDASTEVGIEIVRTAACTEVEALKGKGIRSAGARMQESQAHIAVRNHRAVFPELILKAPVEVKSLGTDIAVRTKNTDGTRAKRNVQELPVGENVLVQGHSNASAESAMSADAADETDLAGGLDLSRYHVLAVSEAGHYP